MATRTRSTTIIAAGVLVAMFGAGTVIAYARSVQSSAGGGQTVQAYTAAADIGPGTRGEQAAQVMKQVAVPAGVVPAAAITSPEAVTGRIVVRPIAAGEVITASQFGAEGLSAAPGAGLQIPPGTNAVTLSLPLQQGVARFVQPGDVINVFATLRDPAGGGGQQEATTKLLLSNILVLANAPAGVSGDPARLGQSSGGEILLTLALSPADAERVVLAKETGSLWFGLVHPGDEPVSTSGQTAGTLLR